ncbi:hypothetical protein [Streptomyces griseoaurantiacus]|uniref:hypothetical protein n=1 Tax=Streptomyces griseoaurantiacus TaxID=68213 RepID=UPI00369BE8B2
MPDPATVGGPPTARVNVPGSVCDWLTVTLGSLGPSPSLDDLRRAIDGARRMRRMFGYFLALDATAPVLELLDAFVADCIALSAPVTGRHLREAARRTRRRIAAALTTLERP